MKDIFTALKVSPLSLDRLLPFLEKYRAEEITPSHERNSSDDDTGRNWARILCLACQNQPPLALVQYIVAQDPQSVRLSSRVNFFREIALHHALFHEPNPSLDVLHFLVEQYPGSVRLVRPLRHFSFFRHCCTPLDVIKFLFKVDPEADALDVSGFSSLISNTIRYGAALETVEWLVHTFQIRHGHVECVGVDLQGDLQGALSKTTSLETLAYVIERLPGSGAAHLCKRAIWCQAPVDVVHYLVQRFPEALRIKRNYDGQNSTLLHTACEYGATLDMLRVLVEADHEATSLVGYGERFTDNGFAYRYCQGLPLLTLCHARHSGAPVLADAIQYMIEQYPSAVNQVTPNIGHLPLHLLCANRPTLKAVKLLVHANPESVRVKDKYGKLPLDKTVNRAPPDVVLFLMEQYPDPAKNYKLWEWLTQTRTPEGAERVVHYVLEQKYHEYLKVPGWLPVHAVLQDDPSLSGSALDYLLHVYSACINKKDANGCTLQHIACATGASMSVKCRLAHLAEGWECRDKNGRLPLHTVFSHQHTNTLKHLKFLIKRNPAALRMADNKGCLPLHLACKVLSPFAVVDLLLKHSPDSVGVTDYDGMLPLMHAAAAAAANSSNKANLDTIYFLARLFFPLQH